MYVFYTVLCKHKNYKEKFVTPIMASQISFDFTINIPLSEDDTYLYGTTYFEYMKYNNFHIYIFMEV